MSGKASAAAGGAGQRATLAQQLGQVARCVQAVQAGRSLTDVLPTVPGPLRPGVQALTFHALRHLGTTTALVRLLTEQEPPAATRALLCAALSLLLPDAAGDPVPASDDGSTPADNPPAAAPAGPVYDAFTVVNQAVDAVRSVRATASHAALVNACLRRYLRERAALHSLAEADWEARYNHPAWWVKRVRRDHPQHWQAILAADNVAAPLVLRVNTARISRDEFMRHLHDAGLTAQAVAHPLAQAAVVLAQPVPVESLPGYAQGWFAVQDTAAQMAAPLLLDGLSGPLRVLDACAAPGGKTAHLLAHAQATGLNVEVLALEVDAARARRIHDNLARLHSGANVQVRVADAAAVPQWWGGEPFDAILLDAPCTASGIVRRHPDVRWLRREADVAALVATQQALLEALWPLLRPGGRMVYCTCSVFRAEGQAQVQAFLQHHTDARQGAAPGHLLPGAGHGHGDMTDNPPGGHDGFFYARFDKVTPIAPALDA